MAGLYLQIELRNAPLNLIKPIIKVAGLVKSSAPINHRGRLALAKECAEVELKVIYLLHLLLVEPLGAFAIFPEAVLDLFVFGDGVSAQAVLLALEPVSFVAAGVGPRVDAEAVFLVVFVLTLVAPPIIPDVDPHPLHIVIKPLALITAAI